MELNNAQVEIDKKVCKKCGRILPLSMFHRNKKSKGGYRNTCKDCVKEYTKIYNEKNKEIIKEKSKQYERKREATEKERKKEYYQKNKEKWQKYNEERYKIRREEALKQKHEYYLKNKESIIARNQVRRARMNSVIGEFSDEQIQECVDFFGNVCAYSGDSFTRERSNWLSMDHIIPITKNGTNYIWNIVPTTFGHNSSKGTKDMLEWYQKQEFYSEERLQRILEWQEYAYQKWGNQEQVS